MIAGAYLRKSTKQDGRAQEERSVEFQRDRARAFAAKKGWLLDDALVFCDDGISGAEFARRPGLVGLLNALKPRPSFQVLIIYDETRLGREMVEVGFVLKTIISAGVEVWFSKDERQRTLSTPSEKMMQVLDSFAAEMHRTQIAERTRDELARKVRAGHVAGGKVFGYRNVRQTDAAGRLGPVDREIVPAHAETVRWIFERTKEGKGYRSIAKEANAAGLPAPEPRKEGRPAGWSPSTVRDVLYRDLYRGVIVWGKRRKRDQWGQKRPTLTPKDDWDIRPAEHLRIVSDDLWNAAHERLRTSRDSYLRTNGGKLWGKPGNGIESQYLLTGLGTCGECGGSLTVRFSSKRHHRHRFYHCLVNVQRGARVCSNSVGLPMQEIDARVLTMFEGQLLDPDAIRSGVQEAVQRLRKGTNPGRERGALVKRLGEIKTQSERLAKAIALGGDLPALVEQVQTLEHERTRIEAEVQRLEIAAQALSLDARKVAAELEAQLVDWRGLLRANVQQARQMLRKLMVGRLVFTPNADKTEFTISGTGLIEPLLEQVLGAPKALVTPAGFEPAISTLKGSRPWPG